MSRLLVSSFYVYSFVAWCAVGASASEIKLVPTTLTPSELRIVDWIDAREAMMLAELKAHVDINTGTANIEGLNRYRAILQHDLSELGFATSEHASDSIAVLSCQGGAQENCESSVSKAHWQFAAADFTQRPHGYGIFQERQISNFCDRAWWSVKGAGGCRHEGRFGSYVKRATCLASCRVAQRCQSNGINKQR